MQVPASESTRRIFAPQRTGGAGSSTHLSAEVFEKSSGPTLSHIPYKGAGEALLELISSNVDLLITATPTAVPQLKGGKARALAVAGATHVPALPDVPTFSEAGLKDYNVVTPGERSLGASKKIPA